ncbi:alpha/beta hydrolase [Kitasatospora cinereorecta]|uniref:Alpha/beta fold hydrolase n=1 Tax=Kitasatospora cinereorecta TaxID=285560 RepID=A0ABW0VKZ8_9ACTN
MTLSHDVAGDGPAVVLLHSAVCDRRMWEPQWSALLAAGYRVVRCDFRGFGGTPVPDGPYSPHADVAALLDTLGIERAALIGASYGGRIALRLAALHPDRVSALALLCAGRDGHRPTAELEALDERENALIEAGDIAAAVELNVDTWLGPEADEDARTLVRTMQRHAFDVQLAAEQEFASDRPEVDPTTVRARCLAVAGAHDFADFRTIAAELADLVPDARHLELPWAGHLPSLERPAEITDLLLAFLDETVPTAK